MPRSRVSCPGCGQKEITWDHRECVECHRKRRREEAEANRPIPRSGTNVPISGNFEPQRIPDEEPPTWTGRPWNDERNNWRMPNWNTGVPVRDIDESPLRIAVTDIETTDLWASMGRILAANTVFYGPGESVTRRADHYAAWKSGKRSDDSEIVKDILMDLEKADIVFAYNGTNFDFPMLRTRALIHGMPPVEPKKIVDPVLLARRVFRFKSNRLDSVARDLGCPFVKTEVEKSKWAEAMLDGSTEAMDYIVEHCEVDVKVLAWVSKRIAPYVRQIDVLGSFRQ